MIAKIIHQLPKLLLLQQIYLKLWISLSHFKEMSVKTPYKICKMLLLVILESIIIECRMAEELQIHPEGYKLK